MKKLWTFLTVFIGNCVIIGAIASVVLMLSCKVHDKIYYT